MQTIAPGPITIDNYFDKIFYINLKDDIARNENILTQFKKLGITNYERVEATKLTELPAREKYRNFIKTKRKYIIGQLSCRASHIQAIKTATERNYKRILIFEDDIIFLDDPNVLLSHNYHVLDDWDMLYFGGFIESHFRNQVVTTHAYAVKSIMFDDIINMADASGMEIDNFYAKILQHMSYNHNQSGKYNIRIIQPFNRIIQNGNFPSNIQS